MDSNDLINLCLIYEKNNFFFEIYQITKLNDICHEFTKIKQKKKTFLIFIVLKNNDDDKCSLILKTNNCYFLHNLKQEEK